MVQFLSILHNPQLATFNFQLSTLHSTHPLLFTIHSSLFTIHYSLFTYKTIRCKRKIVIFVNENSEICFRN